MKRHVFVQNDVVSFIVIQKKKKKQEDKTKKQCHFDCTIHLLLPLNALKIGKKGFFPLLCSVSLSLSHLPKNTDTTHTPYGLSSR
jgi:hypothetical protein